MAEKTPRDEVRRAIFECVAAFYNRTRRHSYLNYEAAEVYDK